MGIRVHQALKALLSKRQASDQLKKPRPPNVWMNQRRAAQAAARMMLVLRIPESGIASSRSDPTGFTTAGTCGLHRQLHREHHHFGGQRLQIDLCMVSTKTGGHRYRDVMEY